MKQGYTIRLESRNPEFDIDQRLKEGMEADGFILLAFRDGKPFAECMQHMTTMDLARFFVSDTEIGSILCQAAAIGEGIRKADQMAKEYSMRATNRQMAERIAKDMLKKYGNPK